MQNLLEELQDKKAMIKNITRRIQTGAIDINSKQNKPKNTNNFYFTKNKANDELQIICEEQNKLNIELKKQLEIIAYEFSEYKKKYPNKDNNAKKSDL